MRDPSQVLAEKFGEAIVAAFGPDYAATDPSLRPSDFADAQANVALALQKKLGKKPRDIATALVEKLDLTGVCDKIEIAGPGFLNLTFAPGFLAAKLEEAAKSDRLGVDPSSRPETVVIDYSAPNIAKEMHVGHLRSTIIGDSLARTLELCGHRVIRQNHLGDWGTPFGMLIEHLVDQGASAGALDVSDLNAFYRAAREKFDGSADFAERSRKRVVALQAGDAATLALWKVLVDASHRYFAGVYAKLGVTLQESDAAGESLYNDMLPEIVKDLEARGLARVDDGALCFYIDGFKNKDGAPLPLVVRKKDGGYGYATTDLAAVKYRTEKLGATRLVYVVGSPQAQHLSMVHKGAALAGWLVPPARAEHVGFGSVLGEDGKMLRTRAGDSVKLMELLEEADSRAYDIVKGKADERGEPMPEAELRAIAHAVGVAAIKYADLSSDRIKDYVFSWERMLATNGNTGPYLQYAHARCRSILRNGGHDSASPLLGAIQIVEKEERRLALGLLGFGGVVRDVATTLEPHRLSTYLYDLASRFSDFWTKCPVLKADEPIRTSRLALTSLTARTLERGLDLLGIEAPPRM
jgi:arginyl-tRNA synthetase